MPRPPKPRPSKRPGRPPRRFDDVPDDADFLAAMRDLEVRPKVSERGRPAPELPRPEIDDDVEDALFLEAMGEPTTSSNITQSAPATAPEPALDGIRRPPALRRTPAEDPAERDLFLQAVDTLEKVPNKDGAQKPDTPSGLQRVRITKRDVVAIDATLDLHRYQVEPALEALERFVRRAMMEKKITLRVITGKGHHSAGGIGKLRGAVEQWIQRRGKTWVKSYAEAPRAKGGRGAFILTLRQT